MINVYVHFEVPGLGDRVHDDDFVQAFWRELPDAALGAHGGAMSITLSQFALSDRRAVARQRRRVTGALRRLGHPDAAVVVDEVVRDDLRDDVDVVARAVRWRLGRLSEVLRP